MNVYTSQKIEAMEKRITELETKLEQLMNHTHDYYDPDPDPHQYSYNGFKKTEVPNLK